MKRKKLIKFVIEQKNKKPDKVSGKYGWWKITSNLDSSYDVDYAHMRYITKWLPVAIKEAVKEQQEEVNY